MAEDPVQILGLAEMFAAFEALGATKAFEEGTKKGAETIAEGARRRTASSTVRAGIRVEGDEIVSTDERAWIEEYGSGPREGLTGPHNFPARPYMRPAMDEDAKRAVDDVAASVKEEL